MIGAELKLTNQHDSAKIFFQNADDLITGQNNTSINILTINRFEIVNHGTSGVGSRHDLVSPTRGDTSI